MLWENTPQARSDEHGQVLCGHGRASTLDGHVHARCEHALTSTGRQATARQMADAIESI